VGQYAHLVSTRASCSRPSDSSVNGGSKLDNAQISYPEGEEGAPDPYILLSRYPSWDADTHCGHGIRWPSRPDEVQEEVDYPRPQASMETSIQYP